MRFVTLLLVCWDIGRIEEEHIDSVLQAWRQTVNERSEDGIEVRLGEESESEQV